MTVVGGGVGEDLDGGGCMNLDGGGVNLDGRCMA
jgi:hypothetical protein